MKYVAAILLLLGLAHGQSISNALANQSTVAVASAVSGTLELAVVDHTGDYDDKKSVILVTESEEPDYDSHYIYAVYCKPMPECATPRKMVYHTQWFDSIEEALTYAETQQLTVSMVGRVNNIPIVAEQVTTKKPQPDLVETKTKYRIAQPKTIIWGDAIGTNDLSPRLPNTK